MSLETALAALSSLRPHGAVAQWTGLDVPLEIIEAAGLWPQRLTGSAVDSPLMAQLGEGGGDPGMRALMAEILATHPAHLLIGSTPVKGIWLYNLLLSLGDGAVGSAQLVDIIREDHPSATERNRLVMRRLVDSFGIDDATLSRAIRDRNAVRAKLRRIDGLRFGSTARLSGVTARIALDTAQSAPAARLIPLLDAVFEAASATRPIAGTPVIYSGVGAADLALYQAFEAAGLRIVGDDQDFGSRAIGPDVNETTPPVEALAEGYRTRDPAAAGWGRRARVGYLLDLARTRGAKAVLFDIAPGDHPAAWDQPDQAWALQAAGVRPIRLPAVKGLPPRERAAAVLASLHETAHV